MENWSRSAVAKLWRDKPACAARLRDEKADLSSRSLWRRLIMPAAPVKRDLRHAPKSAGYFGGGEKKAEALLTLP